MNTLELKEQLDKLEVNPDFYSLEGELLEDRIILYENYKMWEVFYFDERGNRDQENFFPRKKKLVIIYSITLKS